MTEYRLLAEPRADLDVAATFDRYENEEARLGQKFLDELRAAYDRITDGPLGAMYQPVRTRVFTAMGLVQFRMLPSGAATRKGR